MTASLVGCDVAAPTPTPSGPPPPPIPQGWRTFTADDGDIRLAVPPDLVITDTTGSISGFRDADAFSDEVIVNVIGPDGVDQPAPGEPVAEWVERNNWLTAGRGPTEVLDQREIHLPAGPTLVMSAQFQAAEFTRWTRLHVIATQNGFALLQFDGDGPLPADVSNEVRLMRELVNFPS